MPGKKKRKTTFSPAELMEYFFSGENRRQMMSISQEKMRSCGKCNKFVISLHSENVIHLEMDGDIFRTFKGLSNLCLS